MKNSPLVIEGRDYDSTSFITGLVLAISSSLFIGSSFIIKKVALRKISASGSTRASAGGYGYLKQWLWWMGLLTSRYRWSLSLCDFKGLFLNDNLLPTSTVVMVFLAPEGVLTICNGKD